MARTLWLSSEELVLADIVYSLAHIRYNLGIVQQAQGHSAEMAVSPHHNYQSAIYNLPYDKSLASKRASCEICSTHQFG
jgi:hypothetical protein